MLCVHMIIVTDRDARRAAIRVYSDSQLIYVWPRATRYRLHYYMYYD